MDTSLDFLHSQSELSSEWVDFRQDLNFLIKQIGRINRDLDENLDHNQMIRRLQFLCYELKAVLPPNLSVDEKLLKLNHYFFSHKSFVAIADDGDVPSAYTRQFLDRALLDRTASPFIISLIYNQLANYVGIPLYFVDLEPRCYLKYTNEGKTIFIDLSRAGRILSADELLETIRRRLKNEKLSHQKVCETLSSQTFLMLYLLELKRLLLSQAQIEKLVMVQNQLLELMPSHLGFLGERALLYYKLKNTKSAIADLKRYFAFQERDKAPQDLVRLYDELT